MLVNKTYKFRIYPNKEQEILIAKVIHGQQHPIWYGRQFNIIVLLFLMLLDVDFYLWDALYPVAFSSASEQNVSSAFVLS